MFEGITNFFKRIIKTEQSLEENSKDTAKERLHLVLMQDRANVSADFLELMKQEIIEVIKKYIEVDEKAIDVRLTNQSQDDGTNGAPALYANIPIINIKNEAKKVENKEEKKEQAQNSSTIETKKVQEEEVSVKEEVSKKKEEEEKAQEEKKEENDTAKKEESQETKQEEVTSQEEEPLEKKEELKSED